MDRSGTNSGSRMLANSSWELASIDNSDGAAPVNAAIEPGLYTLAIRADGTANFRLDCNRGFGKWQSSKDTAGDGGSIAFTDIGVTKAMCSPDSIDDRVTADLGRFDRYELQGESLTLSANDGAIEYRWRSITMEQNTNAN